MGVVSSMVADRVREEVVRQHAEDAAFLANLRGHVVASPIAGLDALAQVEARLDASCRALAIAGEVGWAIARPAWSTWFPGECFAALRLAFDLRDWNCVDEVLDAIELRDDDDPDAFEQLDACVMALAFLPPKTAVEIGQWWLSQADPLRWSLGLACLLEHRIDPGARLRLGLTHRAAWTRAVAHRGAALLGLPEQTGSDDSCPRVRLFANLARLRQLGSDSESFEALVALAPACDRHGDLACAIGFSGSSPERIDAEIQRILAGTPQHRRLAFVGAIGVGDPVFVPWIISNLQDPICGLAATSALVALTGLDPDDRGLICGPPSATDEQELIDEPDIDCPWLDPAATREWWSEAASSLPAGRRVMFGEPMPGALRPSLFGLAPQRVRALAAWRLALIRPGAVFAYDAPAVRQRRWLAQLGEFA